jgi:hypothetical protein
LGRRLWLRGRRQSLRSIGEIAFGAALVTVASGWLFGFRPEQRPGLAVAIMASVTALIVAGDIVLDVLGEACRGGGACRLGTDQGAASQRDAADKVRAPRNRRALTAEPRCWAS